VYYIHGPELMKLIFAVLYVSLTMGLTLVIKRKFFNICYDYGLRHYNRDSQK